MQDTRSKLLKKASQEILRHGFQGTRIDVILDKVGVAKGALYHYFKDKTDLGYAVVDEVIYRMALETWINPLEASSDPLETLSSLVKEMFCNPPKKIIETGCPLNNLALEMSTVDEGFRQRINEIYTMWREAISDALKQGQANNIVRKDIQCEKVAAFIVASIAGCLGTAKNARSAQLLKNCGESLTGYLESLRENK